MAQAAIVLREKRRRERRNTLQPASLDDDDDMTSTSTLQQHLHQIAKLAENYDLQTVNEKRIRRVRFDYEKKISLLYKR